MSPLHLGEGARPLRYAVPMRVAVTGVSGFIGSVVARHLLASGHAVTGLVRPTSRRTHIEDVVDRFVVGDQHDPSCWDSLLDGADCVVHASFDWSPLRGGVDVQTHYESNLLGSIRLLDASAPRQFIYLSTVAVHHQMHPREHTPDGLGIIDELHVTRPATLYGACKAAVENHLWSAHFGSGRNMSIIRPCAVYGIDPKLTRSIGHPIIEQIRDREPYNRSGGGKFVHVDDVARLIANIVGHPETSGRVFDMADSYARWSDWAQMTAELLGVEAQIEVNSPPLPVNMFDKRAAESVGVVLERGHEGIRRHLAELARVMEGAGTSG